MRLMGEHGDLSLSCRLFAAVGASLIVVVTSSHPQFEGSFAAEASIGKDMAHRLFRAASIAPHRSRSFKLSNDPAFVEKVRDITGLYLNPPDHALARTQPLLPMGLGYVEGVTHGYVRHGTTTLFAALDVANGQVISRVRKHHRQQEFLDFLRQVDKQTPPDLDLYLIVDNYVTHKHAKVKAWLARNPRFHMHTSRGTR